MKLSIASCLVSACLLAAEGDSSKRYYNSTPVRFWPLLEVLDYGQPPTHEVEALWPLLDWEAGQKRTRLHMFPFLWFGAKPEDTYLFVVPFYAQRKKADSHAELFFPLFSTVQGEPEMEPYALVPHLATRVDTDKERAVRVLGPTLKLGKGAPTSDKPYTIADLLNLGGLLKLAEFRSDAKAVNLDALSVLSFRGSRRAPKPYTRIEGPSIFGLPLFSHLDHGTWSSTHLFPVLWHCRGKRGRYLYVWPLAGADREGEHERWYWAAWPLLIYNRDDEKDTRLLGFPCMLAGYSGSPKSRYCWALPLAMFGKDADGSHIRMLMPLYFDYKRKGRQARFILPVHGFYDDGEGYRRDFVLGNLFGYARKAGTDWRQYDLLWPIAAYRKSKDETHSRLLPVWWHIKDSRGELHLACPPLFMRYRDKRETNVVSFPFVWYSREHHKKADRRSIVLFPLLWDSRDYTEQTRSSVLFPLVWDFQNQKDKSRVSTIFPLMWRYRDESKQRKGLVLFPSLWMLKAKERRTVHVWPFFGWRRAKNERQASVVWPFFRYSWRTDSERKSLWLLWPLVNWKHIPSKDYRHAHVLSFWFRRHKDKKLVALVPFVWRYREEGFTGTGSFWYLGRPKDREIDRRNVVLWKLLTYEHRTNGHYDFRILHKLIRVRKAERYSEAALNPLVRVERDADVKRFSILGPTFQYERDAGGKRLRVLHFLKIPLP